MNPHVKQELVAIVGQTRATDRPEDLVAYSMDPYVQEHRPDIVLFPLTTEEVSSIMKVANREEIPVTARGSGTNLAGETVPLKGGIVLALGKMDKILDIDPRNRYARVQPGVINFDLAQAVEKLGLMYPPDPSSWKVCTVGGNVATNAGGPKTLKYGVTRDFLLGLTAVLANGDVLHAGGLAVKNVAGYDLTSLLCGSEGTLGIVTEIIVKLVPKPLAKRTLLGYFPKLGDSSEAVAAIVGAGIIPSGLELMDKVVISAVEKDSKLGLPLDVDAILLVEVDGDPDSLDPQVAKIERILKEHHASGVVAAATPEEAEKLWTARRAALSVMARLRPYAKMEDTTVPISNLTQMITRITEISEKHGVQIGVVAHAGDGNLHPLVLFDPRDPVESQKVAAATEEMLKTALELGGTLTGEHGIGIDKARFLPLQLDPVAMAVTKSIKQSLDPKGILNPGKFV